MSNYSVTGSLEQAHREIGRALTALPQGERDGKTEALFRRLLRLEDAVRSAEKQARKLIPGDWKPSKYSRQDLGVRS